MGAHRAHRLHDATKGRMRFSLFLFIFFAPWCVEPHALHGRACARSTFSVGRYTEAEEQQIKLSGHSPGHSGHTHGEASGAIAEKSDLPRLPHARVAAARRGHLGDHGESTVESATIGNESHESHESQDQEQGRCTICLESDPAPLQRGCACRGEAGLSHFQCMANLADWRDKNGPATETPGLAWIMCLVCKSHFTGAMKQELAHAWSERSLHLPTDHLTHVWSKQHLIECAYAAGNYAEAETMARSMLDRNRTDLGETHPITLYTKTMLGNSLSCLERYKEAEEVQREVLADTSIVSGPRGRVTASQMSSLSNTLAKQRKFTEALRLAKEAVAILRADGSTGSTDDAASTDRDREKMFLTSASGLAHLFLEQGDGDGARALYSEVLSMQSRILGPDHPETLSTKANLAATMSRQGNYEEAKRLEIEVLRTMQRVLGPTHPHTAFAKENLEYTLRRAQAIGATGATGATSPGSSKDPRGSKSTTKSASNLKGPSGTTKTTQAPSP